MMIRMLTMGQLPEALFLANDLFEREMAPHVSQACTSSFHAFASEPVIQNMMQQGKLHMWGAFDENDQLVAVSSMNDPYHISMICVKEDHRMQGISRELLAAMEQFGAMPGQTHPLTVNALTPTIPYFEHVGFTPAGQTLTMMDVTYLPMQRGLPAGSALPAYTNRMPGQRPPEKMPGWLKGLIALICMVAVAVFIYAASLIVSKSAGLSAGNGGSSDFQEYVEQFNEDQDEKEPGKEQTEQQNENTGISSIPSYTQKDLSYQIQDKAFSEEESTGKYKIKLSVHYPQLDGFENDQDKINKKIKDFALKTEKAIYETPDEAQKKKILELENVYVYNEVTYNVTYATDDFISIVFNDVSLLSDTDEDAVVQVRTLNLNLDTGDDYAAADVFSIDQADFQKVWEESVRSEAGETLGPYLPEFSSEKDVAILTGKEDAYPPAYFVDADGVEIGFSISEKDKSRGWVTGPVSKEEIVKYKTDSDFWERVTWK